MDERNVLIQHEKQRRNTGFCVSHWHIVENVCEINADNRCLAFNQLCTLNVRQWPSLIVYPPSERVAFLYRGYERTHVNLER